MPVGTTGNTNREIEKAGNVQDVFSRPEREQRIPVRTERERIPEHEPTAPQKYGPEVAERGGVAAPPTSAAIPAPVSPAKDALTQELENALSEDLGMLYAKMTPVERMMFKREGERTASLIRVFIEEVKVKSQKILDLIRRWLRLIPGVNKFFLEQEAKIKTDKVMALHQRLHGPPS
ncbi:MAG: hypothetical protein HY420_03705 [Candidatus Kerfeldbacteria bacterium]|nr:hypothetical protein [Candidatus Kerfeldbacteria bacterium]